MLFFARLTLKLTNWSCYKKLRCIFGIWKMYLHTMAYRHRPAKSQHAATRWWLSFANDDRDKNPPRKFTFSRKYISCAQTTQDVRLSTRKLVPAVSLSRWASVFRFSNYNWLHFSESSPPRPRSLPAQASITTNYWPVRDAIVRLTEWSDLIRISLPLQPKTWFPIHTKLARICNARLIF